MRQHLVSLDGLRGVAALAVVGSHFENLSGYSLYLQQAGMAVDFFFVLSGFVIAQAYETRLNQGLSWRDYMGLRLARLYPAIFGGLIVGLALTALAGGTLYPAMALQFLLLPVLQGAAVNGGELFPLNGPQWSLFLELTINAVHAAAVRWLTTPLLIAIASLAAAALVLTSLHFDSLDVGWGRRNIWGGPPRVIYSFCMGLLIHRAGAKGLKAPAAPYWLLVAALTVCMFRVVPALGAFALRDIVIVIVVLPGVVAMAVQTKVSARFQPLALWLGALSYPLYAIHVPLLRGFATLLADTAGSAKATGWCVALALTLILSALFERAYDAPIREWLRRRGTTAIA